MPAAFFLLWTPVAAFTLILPWLLLAATLALAFGGRIGDRMQGRVRVGTGPVLLMQFLLGVYGGYFGGAVGLMMVALWTVLGESDLKALNGPRTLLVSAANTIAALAFIVAGAIRWPETLVLLLGGVAGGYAGRPPRSRPSPSSNSRAHPVRQLGHHRRLLCLRLPSGKVRRRMGFAGPSTHPAELVCMNTPALRRARRASSRCAFHKCQA